MMTVSAVALFFVSLIAIVSLFVLKRWELVNNKVLGNAFRAQADVKARVLKMRLVRLESQAGMWWPKALLIMRYFIHLGALATARTFRRGEMWMHALADRVSHKHQFERRATRSEFLREVTSTTKKVKDSALDIQG